MPDITTTTSNPFLEPVLGPGSWPRCAGRYWWIDTFRLNPSRYHKWQIVGWNDHAQEAREIAAVQPEYSAGLGPEIHWSVPKITDAGNRYAFRMRVVANDADPCACGAARPRAGESCDACLREMAQQLADVNAEPYDASQEVF